MKFMSPSITSVPLLHISDGKLHAPCHDEIALPASCHDRTDSGPFALKATKLRCAADVYPFIFISFPSSNINLQ